MNRDERRVIVFGYANELSRDERVDPLEQEIAKKRENLEAIVNNFGDKGYWLAYQTEGGKWVSKSGALAHLNGH